MFSGWMTTSSVVAKKKKRKKNKNKDTNDMHTHGHGLFLIQYSLVHIHTNDKVIGYNITNIKLTQITV